MYILPQPYKCDRCGYERQYSPHVEHPSPAVLTSVGPVVTCPVCWAAWLTQNIGLMRPTDTKPTPTQTNE